MAGGVPLSYPPRPAPGFFLGDFTGITGTNSGFQLLYASTNPAESPAFTDVRFQSVTLP